MPAAAETERVAPGLFGEVKWIDTASGNGSTLQIGQLCVLRAWYCPFEKDLGLSWAWQMCSGGVQILSGRASNRGLAKSDAMEAAVLHLTSAANMVQQAINTARASV